MIPTKQSFSLKIILTLMFASTTHFSSNLCTQISEEAIANCYEPSIQSDWKYLEYNFIFNPTKKIEAVHADVNLKMTAFGAGLLLWISNPFAQATASAKSTSSNEGSTSSNEGSKSSINTATLISAGLLSYCIATWYNNIAEYAIRHETLVNFINNWSFHRDLVPHEFVTIFDELALCYQASASKKFTNEQVSQIFNVIQHLIEHNFEKRYPKEKKSADMLSGFKTITDICKTMSGK